MSKLSYKILIVFIFFLVSSCKKNETPLVILISPATTLTSEAGETIVLNLEFICDEAVSNLKIFQKNYKYETSIICDTVPLNNKFDFVYNIPFEKDSSYLILDFYAKTNSFSQNVSKKILVINNEELLTEYSGNIIYSKLSGKPFAYNINALQSEYIEGEDFTTLDFLDFSIDSVNQNMLSRKWISVSGIEFARFNDFDYAKATNKSISDVYKYATRQNEISNLTNDDILLIGKEETPIGSIRITQIIDEDTTLNDRYYFNIKLIERYKTN